jgi:SAM-dependent methyltransferase
MDRVPEPELMDDPAQALAYDEADFDEPHQRLVDGFAERFPGFGDGGAPRVLDLGCGPGDVTVRFALAHPTATVLGVDGAEAMLARGRRRVAAAGLSDRVRLERMLLPAPPAVWAGRRFDAVVSNSLLHHLHDPAVLWETVVAVAERDVPVFVADLRRPADEAAVDALVARYAADEPEVLRHDFRASLRAAFSPEEIAGQVAAAGLGHLTVDLEGDRHVVVWGRR